MRSVRSGVLLLAVLAAGCSRPRPVSNALNLSLDSSTAVTVARFSASPTSLVLDSTAPRTLITDLTVHHPDLGDIAAVAELHDGRVAVLNRRDRVVVVIDSAGAISDTVARGGEGPGELGVPWAIGQLGDQLLILQRFPLGNMLTLVPLDSRSAVAQGPTVSADWTNFTFRGPNLQLDFPTQAGTEDWARRLTILDDSNFVLAMRDSAADEAPAMVNYLHFGSDLILRDTLGHSLAPVTIPGPTAPPGVPQVMQDHLFTARPWFVAGSGWRGHGDGDSAAATVRYDNGSELRIVWPVSARPLAESDQLAAAHWAALYTTRAYNEAREQFRAMTAQQRAEAEKQFLPYLPFAQQTPEVSAVFGAGNCIWFSGFAPQDFMDGTALTLLGVNLADRRMVGPIRIAGADQRIKLVTRIGIYVKRFDENDEAYLVRYRLPDEAGC